MMHNAIEERREYQCAWRNANLDKIRPLKNDFLRKMTKFLREKKYANAGAGTRFLTVSSATTISLPKAVRKYL